MAGAADLLSLLYLPAGGLLNLVWSKWMDWLRISFYVSNQTQETLFASALAAQIFGPGLLVPIAEEVIFRGIVYTRMKTRLSRRQAVVLSSLLFSLYHGNLIQIIYAFPMAILLALIYERDGKIVNPILFHMGANLTAILSALQ